MDFDKTKPLASLSLDLDNLWIYLRDQGLDEWRSYPSYLNASVPRMLSLFSDLELSVTIFVIGRDLRDEDHRRVFESIAASEHEIANHSFSHPIDFHRSDVNAIVDEIAKTEDGIKALTGKRPKGFRGPSFRLSSAILQTLIDRGYQYDASVFPTFMGPLARRYYLSGSNLSTEQRKKADDLFGSFSDGMRPMKPYSWHCSDGTLAEVPVTTYPLLRIPIHATYLNFLADFSPSLAKFYFVTAMKLCRLRGISPSLLLHATDFLGSEDIRAPTFLPGFKRTSGEKIDLLREILFVYKKLFEVKPITDYVERAEKEIFNIASAINDA